MKNILVDILHPAHLNLFKNMIRVLSSMDNYNVIIICIERGKLPEIVQKELDGLPCKVIGKHRNTKFSIIFEANLLRFFQLLFFILKSNIDIGLSFGSFLTGAILTFTRKPNIHFSDDPERKLNAILENLTCTERYLPPIVQPSGKTKIMNALKEWAYLSPQYFSPDKTMLDRHNLNPNEYIFIREVSTGSLNYSRQKENIIASFATKLPNDIPVLFSLENKKTISMYPSSWILLDEPVEDIHSLIYYSKLVISSGDSMAREGVLLGNPSIYCGIREMKVNQILIDRKMLFKIAPDMVSSFVEDVISNKINIQDQETFRQNLMEEWTDVTQFLIDLLTKERI